MSSDIIIKKENDGDVINMFDDFSSDDSSIEINNRPRVKKSVKKPYVHPPQHQPSTVQPQPQPQPQQAFPNTNNKPLPTLNDNMFEVFTNPDKKRVIEESEDSFQEDTPIDASTPYYPPQPSTDYYADVGGDSEYDEDAPAEGFNSVEEEKQDYLYKFYRLQSKGVPIQKKFNINSNIHEMRSEFNRIKRDAEVNSSIRFSRRMLMACVTAVEFMNKRYDPFDIKLDGWSESVMQNVDDYDNVFERLHDKYASKVTMAPEIELMLSLAGSAFMFHLTNSMFNSMPNLKDIAKQNPDILKNMMESMAAAASSQPAPHKPTTTPQESPAGEGFREMRGPMFDMSNLMGMMQPPQHQQPPPQPPTNPMPITNFRPIGNEVFDKSIIPINTNINTIESPSEVSSESLSNKPINTKHISFSETTSVNSSRRRGGRNKIQSTSENTITL
jgi:hypothetical protein